MLAQVGAEKGVAMACVECVLFFFLAAERLFKPVGLVILA